MQNSKPKLKDDATANSALAQKIVEKLQKAFELHNAGELEQARVAYEDILIINPKQFDALQLSGMVAAQTKQWDKALSLFTDALKINTTSATVYNNCGIVLNELKRLEDALESYDRAIQFECDYAEAYYNRGIVLNELKRLEDARTSYDKAIALKPDYAEAFNNRGIVLNKLKRLEDALESYDKAIALKPNYAEAFNNRGIVLNELKCLEDALASYDKAIALKPDYAEAFNNRGNVLHELKRLDDALASYDKANALKPDLEFLLGTKLHLQMSLCDWSDLENQLKGLEASVSGELKVSPPFQIIGMVDKPELQLKVSSIYANERYPALHVSTDFVKRTPDGKIRIGYYSADFRNHVVSDLIVELFELHNSDLFEVFGFSFGPSSNDEMRQRISNALYRFIDISMKSDTEVAQISRSLGIDIAIDLGGFTKDSRPGIFSAHSAPIQVSYLGYPGTMGASYIDYIIADNTLIPSDSQQYYREKIIYLPYSFQVNDSKRKIADKVFTRQDLGLPDSGFVFCCFNNNYKILPQTFDSWMRLLKSVNGSVLWLYVEQPTAIKNLKKEAEARGVDPSRLVFATRMNGEYHLARQRVADLFLDTLPFNAGATASTALWSGLPVLTLIGNSFVARYAASLLNAIDLTELITSTSEEYESKAVELAKDPLKLAQIKRKLDQNRQTSPLFNGQLFARHIEAAYLEIHQRHLSGKKPDHVYVKALTE